MKLYTRLVFLMLALGSIRSFAGTSEVLTNSEVIEISNPKEALTCAVGNDGFIFTTVSLNIWSIPEKFGSNFKGAPGISVYFPNGNDGKAMSCAEAMKPIEAEIAKQGGQLKVLASRSLSRFAYPDHGCKLFLAENIEITVGSVGLSGVATFFIAELPISSWEQCGDLVPDKI